MRQAKNCNLSGQVSRGLVNYELLKMGVLLTSQLKDRNIRIGVLPLGEEFLVFLAAIGFIALESIGTSQVQMCQRVQWRQRVVDPWIIDKLPKLYGGLRVHFGREKSLAAQISDRRIAHL